MSGQKTISDSTGNLFKLLGQRKTISTENGRRKTISGQKTISGWRKTFLN